MTGFKANSASPTANLSAEADTFEFGNLINDPTPRTHVLKAPVKARYVRIDALSTAGDDDTVAIAEIDLR